MANWYCSVFNVVCRKRLPSPRCRSELIDSAWVGIVPRQIMHKKKLKISKTVDFHQLIKRNNYTTFKTLRKFIKTQTKNLQVNRNIIAPLFFSIKHEKVIDMENAFKYPSSHIPLIIANVDGSKRETSKCVLAKIILDKIPAQTFNGKGAFVVNFIAQIRTTKDIPDTYEELTWLFIKSIPRDHQPLDIVVDSYVENSIKTGTIFKRGN